MDSATYPAIGASTELAGPWRRAAFVAFGFAVVEAAALVVIGVTLLAAPIAHLLHSTAKHKASAAAAQSATKKAPAPAPTRTPAKAAAPAKPELTRAHTRVLVLNGNGISGAAHLAATTITAHGYPTPATGNAYRSDYATSFVMYRPGYQREARRLARDTSIHSVVPLDGKPGALHGAKLILILGK